MTLHPIAKLKVRKLGFNYLIVVALIAVASFAAWKTNTSAKAADQLLAHTLVVQKELGDMLTNFTKLEADSWAFILTGDEKFLETQKVNRAAINEGLKNVRAATNDNAEQQKMIGRLEILSTEQMAFKDRLIALAKEKGLDAGRAAVEAGNESKLEEMKAQIARMVAEEERLLPQRRAAVSFEDRSAEWLFAALAFVAVLFLTISNLRIHRLLGEAKQSATRLREEQDSLIEAQALAKVGSWAWEVGSEEVVWSDELYQIFQMARGQRPPMFQEYNQHLFVAESEDRLAKCVESAIRKGESFSIELEGIRLDGDRFFAWATGRAVRDDTGTVTRLFGTVQDVSEAHAALERERQLVREGKVALEAKEHFLAVMSHEIRTPINGIIGFAEQLAEKSLAVEQVECVEVIHASGRSLLRIVNSMLDFSEVQSGKFALTENRFSMRRLLEGISNLLPRLGPSSLVFVVEVSPTLPDQFWGDGERLSQILTNLVENSMKYARDGAVTIRVHARVEREDADSVWVECRIQDNGIGIAPEKLELIFEPFLQAENTLGRHYGGVGLGLSIARQLILAMGGDLSVTSKLGEGSEFTVSLPLKIANSEPLEEQEKCLELLDLDFARRHPLSILVAEDDSINRRVILHLLAKLGYTAEHAWNGFETLAQCGVRRPDCILMDLHMPQMNGFDAMRAIRSEEKQNGKPPIHVIAYSADILQKARRECVEAGMNDYLSKPTRIRDLADALIRCH